MKAITTFSPTKLRGKKLFLIALAFFSFIISSHAVESNGISKQQDTGEKIRKKRNDNSTNNQVTVYNINFLDYFTFGGDASHQKLNEAGEIGVMLTTDERSKVGNFTLGTQIDVNTDFSLKGYVFLGYKEYTKLPYHGADGMGFAFHRSPVGQVGKAGGAIGIGGLKDAVGIKFDTFMNHLDYNDKDEPFFRDPSEYEHPQIPINEAGDGVANAFPFMAFAHTKLGKELGGSIPEKLKEVPIVITDKPNNKYEASESSGRLPPLNNAWWYVEITYNGTSKTMTCNLYPNKEKIGIPYTISKNIGEYLKKDADNNYLPYSLSVSASTGWVVNNHGFYLDEFTYNPVGVAYTKSFLITEREQDGKIKTTIPITDFFEYRGNIGDTIYTDKLIVEMANAGYIYKKYARVADTNEGALIEWPGGEDSNYVPINSYVEDEYGQGRFILIPHVQAVYYYYEELNFNLFKSVDKAQAVQNETLEYTITVKNNEDVALKNVIIYDELDKRLEFISSENSDFEATDQTEDGREVLSTTIPYIEPNGEVEVKFKAKIRANTPSGGTIINEAFVEFGQIEKTSNAVHTDILPGVMIEGTKNLTGREMNEGEFEFEVLSPNGLSYNPRITAKNEADGTFHIKLAGYTQIGNYRYKIREINKNDTDIIYDDKEYDLTVVIAGSPSGGVTTTAIIKDGGIEVLKPVFNNMYIPDITKEVDKATPQLGENITYTIKPVLPSDIKTNYIEYLIYDELPAGISFESATTNQHENWDVVNEGNKVIMRAKKFASMPTDPLVITITAKVNEDAAIGKAINNTAAVYLKNIYNKELSRNSNTVPITPKSPIITITAEKKWEKGKSGTIPESAVLSLAYIIGTETVVMPNSDRTVNENNEWTATWQAAKLYPNNIEVQYTIVEKDAPEGYTASVARDIATGLFTITNRHESATGINLVKIKNKISLSPNPVADILYISSKNKIKRIELIDILGKLILTKESANETELTLDLSSLNTGIYYLRVTEEGAFSTLKLIKR